MATFRSPRLSRWAPTGLAAVFVVTGTLHLVRPAIFLSLVPDAMPARDAIVLVSGIAELVCAAGLLTRAQWAGPASALLLCAVFPGNVLFAIDATRDPGSSSAVVAAAWLRLPLQLPLIWAALQADLD
jgi:uncharacterized membrane protein